MRDGETGETIPDELRFDQSVDGEIDHPFEIGQ
jgi:hypothetical protein